MRTLIANGLVVTGSGAQHADVLVEGETIARVGPDIAQSADRVIEADGCCVLPGIIDAHTHPVYLDDIESLAITAAHGGVTTLIHYAYAKPGDRLLDTIHRFREEGEGASVLDFALHGGLFDAEHQSSEIPEAIARGVTSHKMFMTYAKLGWMTDDYQLMRTLDVLGRAGGMGMVHAENGLATDYLQDKLSWAKQDPRQSFVATRPAILEAEAVHRAIAMARVAGCSLYIPHVSAGSAIEEIARARSRGFRVFGETCPQYLTLTNDDLLRLGPLLKIGPPLRDESDRAALWRALANAVLDVIASDHAAKDKRIDDDFFEAPYGSPQVETMLALAYHGGVAEERLSLPRLVQVMCENPARIFGLHPRKGTIRSGSDADLVVFDPARPFTITHATQHSNAPYTAYEGRECAGAPVLTMQRGEVVLQDGKLVARTGRGRFLRTNAGKVRPEELINRERGREPGMGGDNG
jgi:dihydropyrimidinase